MAHYSEKYIFHMCQAFRADYHIPWTFITSLSWQMSSNETFWEMILVHIVQKG